MLGQVLRGKYSVLSSMDRGKFIVTIDYECQAVATIFLVHLMLLQLVLTASSFILGLLYFAAPIPSTSSIALFAILSLCLSFLIRNVNVLGQKAFKQERDSQKFVRGIWCWKIVKLNSAGLSRLIGSKILAQSSLLLG